MRPLALCVCLGLCLIAAGMSGCGSPQIGMNPEAFAAIDALYTAVSLRDAKLVDQSAAVFQKLREGKTLPDAASATIDDILARARATQWEDAQTRLADFMRAQHR